MIQGSLLDESAKIRHDAAETARLAALKNAPASGTQRHRVLRALTGLSPDKTVGLTDDELSQLLAMSPNTLRPRRVELVEGGWVEDSGLRRNNQYGNTCIVWRCTEKGTSWRKQNA